MPPQRPDQRSDNRTRFGPRLPPELWRMVLQGLAEAHRRDRYERYRSQLEQNLRFPDHAIPASHPLSLATSNSHTWHGNGLHIFHPAPGHIAQTHTRIDHNNGHRVVENRLTVERYDAYGRPQPPP